MFFASPVIRRSDLVPQPADQALQRFLQAAQLGNASGFSTTTSDNATTLSVDVPGLSREQLQLRIEGAQVQLNSVEGAPRQVRRSWELSHEIDVAASSAKLENGVLTMTLAKRQPVDKSVTLSIQ